MRALVARQLRMLAPLIAGAAFGTVLFVIFMVWIADSVELGPDFALLLEAVVPPAFARLILDQFGMASFVSAIAFGFEHPLVLAAGISVIITIASIPAAERETGVLDLVLARPVPRYHYLAAHVLLLVVVAVLLPLVMLAGSAIGIRITDRGDEVSWTHYIGAAFSYAPLLLVIGAYTLWLAAGSRRRGSAIAPAIALTLAFVMYDVLASMWQRLDGYEWPTIFHYYAPVQQVTGDAGIREPLILLALAGVMLLLAFVRFGRQQL